MSLTALQIIQQACGELGLPTPDAVAGTTEETNIQMLALLNAAGYDLAANYQWEELNSEYLFDTVADQMEYPLPDDYNYFLDSTGWDRSNRWPLLGPVSQQEWQALVAAKVQAVSRTYYMLRNKKISLWPVPYVGDGFTDPRKLAISYASLNWVMDASDTTSKPMINQDGDVPRLNPWLLIKFLKLKTWQAKGFNTEALATDFKVMFESISAKSKGSRVLSLAPKTGTVFIGVQNVPEGNWVR